MKSKSQNGFVIELMIVFMLVTFGFCMVITAFVSSLSIERKNAKSKVDSQTALNQIGEYYMRSVEAGGVFPTSGKDDLSSFSWMDDNGDGIVDENDETVEFFKSHKNYTFTDKLSVTYGGIAEFFKEKGIYRRLTVKQGEKSKLILTVNEKFTGENSSDCEIVTWYMGDDVVAEREEEFEQKDLNTLEKMIKSFWNFFDKLNKIRDNRKSLSTVEVLTRSINAFNGLFNDLRDMDFSQMRDPEIWRNTLTEIIEEVI